MRHYTWKPDLPDARDHLYSAPRRLFGLLATPLPAAVDLRAKCPPVFDQGQLGSCTANALAGAMGFLHPGLIGSRLFVYYNERAMEGTIDQDAGAQIRDGVKTLAKIGVCPEAEWPYKVTKFKTKPAAKCFADAGAHTISEYQRITGLDAMLHCLASGFPFVFGFTVYDGFESDEVAKTGVLNLPTRGEKNLGGHAVMAVGYDLAAKRITVRNSWGAAWGQSGYFTMPFDYLTHRGLSDDFWTLRK
jgi:C1A family cysteine protease